MKRLAYIISAYIDAEHLLRMTETLGPTGDFYVHIDKKTDITPFECLLKGKVHFVRRHWSSWGGWKQVEYQKELLGAAIESGNNYSHIICLSGQDYPLWSPQRILRHFNENHDKEFIAGYNLTQSTHRIQQRRIGRHHFFRDLEWNNMWLKNKLIVASRWLTLPFRRPLQAPISGQRYDVYLGSDYWALTLECAKYVHRKLSEEEELCNYFRHSFVPSEMCIHTIVFNSAFAPKALLWKEPHYPGIAVLTPLHFIDYSQQIKILDESDHERLVRSNKMFCRKVVTGMSDKLVETINRSFSAD